MMFVINCCKYRYSLVEDLFTASLVNRHSLKTLLCATPLRTNRGGLCTWRAEIMHPRKLDRHFLGLSAEGMTQLLLPMQL
jgi:hypothetical protein